LSEASYREWAHGFPVIFEDAGSHITACEIRMWHTGNLNNFSDIEVTCIIWKPADIGNSKCWANLADAFVEMINKATAAAQTSSLADD
jgi:hypothetical protein